MYKILIILLIPIIGYSQNSYLEAKSLYNSKDYEVSENVLKASLINSPNNLKSLELLGEIYTVQENWDDAINLYKRLIKLDSLNANYHYSYGKTLGMKATKSNVFSAFMMKNEIEEEFLTTIQLDNNHIDGTWALIVYYTELPGIIGGSLDKAIYYAERLKFISKVDHYLAMGYIYEDEKNFKQAEENYKLAIEEGGSIICYQKLISLYVNNERYEEAINILEIANKMHNWNLFNFQIGKISALKNIHLEKGKNSLNIFIDDYSELESKKLKEAYYYLSKIYRVKNDKKNALQTIDKSLEIDSGYKDALNEKKLILKM